MDHYGEVMPDKFRVTLTKGLWQDPWPTYFNKFYQHCRNIADENNWVTHTTINYELKPLGGKLIVTKTQGWYLRWEKESDHTAFVLKWS
jgi:hypothetical protein